MVGSSQRGPRGHSSESKTETLEFVPKFDLDRALEEVERLREKNERLQGENERLQKELEEARRALKRQTAPFSRRKRKPQARRKGRKSGSEHGKHYRRPVPESVDERYRAALPAQCECGGPAIRDDIKPQYQEEIVRKKLVRQFDVEIGHCACCGKRLQGRHPLQTSDAIGCGGSATGARSAQPGSVLEQAVGNFLR